MLYSKCFIPTQKEAKSNCDSVSQELINRAGLVYQSASGHYAILPLGKKVLNKIENIIRQELNNADAVELTMPIMQPASLWQESGRWDVYGDEMYKLQNRSGREFCLGPTHEELIVDIIRKNVHSYKELPLILFQIGTKFRDELRPRNGLVRAKEFIMKDAYSFDVDEKGLDISYEKIKKAYLNIFNRLNLKVECMRAESGEIGGNFSEEFIAYADSGEDKFKIKNSVNTSQSENEQTEKEHKGIEIGHIFKLGTRYSKMMNLNINNSDGMQTPLIMGCYGIGISRLLPVLVEQHHDSKGIIWPKTVAPFDVEIIPIRYDLPDVHDFSLNIYHTLKEIGVDVLLDDRDISGAKFKDADLLGVPYKMIVSKKTLERKCVELEDRQTGSKSDMALSDIPNIRNMLT